ncbi:hypothetical protein HK100_006188 [Physocladia obscura]|uniref:Amino acid transporter transmembrane domain-containing protein n=1 Tax=Physocladia obscura TaxID=109957 RepID=A0AAD5XG79_9FUNG|nr:hypothetical protein HK100_006188 [Physocladia obscura]
MTGSGIPYTPSLFATLGGIPPFILFGLFAVISAFSVLFIVEAMQAMPGASGVCDVNAFCKFNSIFHFPLKINIQYFGPLEHVIGQIFIYGAIQSQAMNNIVLSAQAFDNILVDIFHKSCGVSFAGNGLEFGWTCFVDNNSTTGSPFGSQPMLFTIGYLIVILATIPFCLSTIDDNIVVQIGSLVLTVVVAAEWMVESTFSLDASRVPVAAMSDAIGNLLGSVILNFACTVFVPTFINFKDKSVSVQKVVWTSMAIAIVLYGVLGLFPALAYTGLKVVGFSGNAANIIPIFTGPQGKHVVVNKIFCYLFSIVMLLPAIPVSFIVSQQNIEQNFRPVLAKYSKSGVYLVRFICYVLPFVATIPILTGTALSTFISWTGVIFVSPANFVVPFIIYLKCIHFRRAYNDNRALTLKQTEILKLVHHQSSTIVNYLTDKSESKFQTGVFAQIRRAVTTMGRKTPTPSPIIVTDQPQTSSPTQVPQQLSSTSAAPSFFSSLIRSLGRKDNSLDGSLTPPFLTLPPVTPLSYQPLNSLPNTLSRPSASALQTTLSPPNNQVLSPPNIIIETVPSSPKLLTSPGHSFLTGVSSAVNYNYNDNTNTSIQIGSRLEPTEDVSEFWLHEPVPDPIEEDALSGVSSARTPTMRGMIDGGAIALRTLSRFGTDRLSKRSFGTFSRSSAVAGGGSVGNGNGPSRIDEEAEDNLLRQESGASGSSSNSGSGVKFDGVEDGDNDGNDGDDGLLDVTHMSVKPQRQTTNARNLARHGTVMPINDEFVSTTFRAIPQWIPIPGRMLATGLLVVTTFMSITVIILQILSVSGVS